MAESFQAVLTTLMYCMFIFLVSLVLIGFLLLSKWSDGYCADSGAKMMSPAQDGSAHSQDIFVYSKSKS